MKELRENLGLQDTRQPWWQDGTSSGRSAFVKHHHNQGWTYLCAILAGLASLFCLYTALQAYRAWQELSNIWVQAVTGRDGSIFALLMLVALGAAAIFGYLTWWILNDRGYWHKPPPRGQR